MRSILWMAVAITAVGLSSCQKSVVNAPASGATTASNSPGIVVGLPPPYIWWAHVSDMPMPATPSNYWIGKDLTMGFAINGKGYVFGGRYDSKEETAEYLNDLWEYDPSTKTWTQMRSYPGTGNIFGTSFVIDGQAFLVIDGNCWLYDQLSNLWVKRASLPGGVRWNPTGFAINGKGYVGLGVVDGAHTSTKLKDWWEFDPNANTWTKKANFPGGAREYAGGFAVGNYGYVCGGEEVATDLWQYNPALDTWTKKTSPPTQGLSYMVGLNGVVNAGAPTGFIVSGTPGGCLEYNPATDKWGVLPDVPGGYRNAFAGFMIGLSLYVAGGTGGVPYGWQKDLEALNWTK